MALLPNFQFRPTFIPKDPSLVVNQFGKTADALDKRFDEQVDFANKLSILSSNVEVGEGDRGIKDAAIKKIDDLITSITEDNIGFENAGLALGKAARDFAKDPALSQARRNFPLQEEARKREADFRSKTGVSFASNFDNFQSVTKDAEGNDVFNTFQATGEATLNHLADAQQHFGTLKADLESLGITAVPSPIPGEPVRYMRQGTTQEITDKDVLDRANVIVDQFMKSSTGGNQFARLEEARLREENPFASDAEISDAVRNESLDLLFSAGENQTVSNVRDRFGANALDVAVAKERLKGGTGGTGGGFTTNFVGILPKAAFNKNNAYKVRKDGNLVVGENEVNFYKVLDEINEKQAKGATTKQLAAIQGVATIMSGGHLSGIVSGGIAANHIRFAALKTWAHAKNLFTSDGGLNYREYVSTETGARVVQNIINSDVDLQQYEDKPEQFREIIESYMEDHLNSSVTSEVNDISNIPDFSTGDPRDRLNKEETTDMFFKPDKDGIPTMLGAVTGLTLIPADADVDDAGNSISGTEFVKRAQDDDLIVTVGGNLPNSNLYSAGARLVKLQAKDDDEVQSFIMQGSNEEVAANWIDWNFHQAKGNIAQMHEFEDGNRRIKIIDDTKAGGSVRLIIEENGKVIANEDYQNTNRASVAYRSTYQR